jgi:hypothetical protein
MAKRGKQRANFWIKHKRTLLGIERQCGRCREWWPADSEFYHKGGNGLHSYCIACVAERCYELRNPGAVRSYTLTPIGSN